MFKKSTDQASALEKTIDKLVQEMDNETTSSKEHASMIDQLIKLHEYKDKSRTRISPDTRAIVIGNLVGIILIVGHERANVMTSKALNFVQKMS